jgi:hypothetical protein
VRLFQRALAILNNQALVYRDQGKYSEAERLLKRALAIRQNLAIVYRGERAKEVLKRALAIREELTNLANLYRDQGKYWEAVGYYARALAISEKALGASHPEVAWGLNNMAILYEALGESRSALAYSRKATAAVLAHRTAESTGAPQTGAIGGLVERRASHFQRHVANLAVAARKGIEPEPSLVHEAVEVAQWANQSEAAAAVQQMSTRFAAGVPALWLPWCARTRTSPPGATTTRHYSTRFRTRRVGTGQISTPCAGRSPRPRGGLKQLPHASIRKAPAMPHSHILTRIKLARMPHDFGYDPARLAPASRLIGEIGMEPAHLVGRSPDWPLEQIADPVLQNPVGRKPDRGAGVRRRSRPRIQRDDQTPTAATNQPAHGGRSCRCAHRRVFRSPPRSSRVRRHPASDVTTEPRNWSNRRRSKSSRTMSDSDSPAGCATIALDPMI